METPLERFSRALDRGWRIFGTGLSFVAFGVGGVALSLTVFPFLRLVSWRRETLQRRIGYFMHLAMRFHVGLMRFVGVIRTEVRDRAALLPPGQLIVANHPTLIDVVLLMSLTPDVGCVVKRGLWRNPFLRWPVVWAGYIPNSDGERLVADCAACLRGGRSLIVFPEGTRTVPGEPMTLKRGAAQIALAAQANVLPVTILCEPLMLNKGVPWYRVPPRPGHFTVAVGQPMTPQTYDEPGRPASVTARHLTAQLATRFERDLERLRREREPNLDTIPHPPQSARL